MIKIEAIQYPWVITSDGQRLSISEVNGNIVPGATIEQVNGGWNVKGFSDPNCEI